MAVVDDTKLALLEYRFTLDISEVVAGDPVLIDALLALYGWSGEPPKTVSEVSRIFDLEPDVLRKANTQYEGFAAANLDRRMEGAVEELSHLLPFPIPAIGQWLAGNGYTKLDIFPIESFFDAVDIYIDDGNLPFRPLSTGYTKWLVDIDEPGLDVDFVDALVEKALQVAPQWGIIDVNRFDSLQQYFLQPGCEELAWSAIDACPDLATEAGTPYVISRQPREDTTIVQRLDRLLSFTGAVPLRIALTQITRDGSESVLPAADAGTLQAFISHCTYYGIEDGDVVSRRNLIVDRELPARERPVIRALVEHPEGATIDDLVDSASVGVHRSDVQNVVRTSPLVVLLRDGRYAVLDPSMYDALMHDDGNVSTPAPASLVTTMSAAAVGQDLVDLAGLGTSGTHWWAMDAGPIHEADLNGARADQQKYMPILEPGTGRCLGMVRTSRVFNKFTGGIPTVLANDKGLRGIELPRFCSPEDLQYALSEAPFVFYNDETRTGLESWGIIQRQDVDWR